MERRSLSDEEWYDERPMKRSERLPSARAQIAKNYRLHSLSTLVGDSVLDTDDPLIETPSLDEFMDIASSRAEVEVKQMKTERKQAYLESWLKRLHFVTLPIYQFGNWIPLVTSRWYCSGHGCGLDQVSFEGKAG